MRGEGARKVDSRPEASELGTWGTATHCTAFRKTQSHWLPYP